MNDKEFTDYFVNLGYTIDWDYNRRLGEQWWEIIDPKTNKMFLQIDKGVPISAIIEDFICLKENRETTSSYDYKINAPISPEFDELMTKIYEQ
jgi:hypothetical protein